MIFIIFIFFVRKPEFLTNDKFIIKTGVVAAALSIHSREPRFPYDLSCYSKSSLNKNII